MDKNNSRVESIGELKKAYLHKKNEIEKRLDEFRYIWNQDDKKIFAELCFCITTPQSKAEACNQIICDLEKNNLLFKGQAQDIRPYLKRTRFYKNKSRYIIEARNLLKNNGRFNLKDKINTRDIVSTREWFVKNIKGIGFKEASHFLRNIGFGKDIAILDVHILRNLKKFKVINEIPKALTKKRYLEIEDRLKEFCTKVKIPLAHIDLLFWSMQTGKIFK